MNLRQSTECRLDHFNNFDRWHLAKHFSIQKLALGLCFADLLFVRYMFHLLHYRPHVYVANCFKLVKIICHILFLMFFFGKNNKRHACCHISCYRWKCNRYFPIFGKGRSLYSILRYVLHVTFIHVLEMFFLNKFPSLNRVHSHKAKRPLKLSQKCFFRVNECVGDHGVTRSCTRELHLSHVFKR